MVLNFRRECLGSRSVGAMGYVNSRFWVGLDNRIFSCDAFFGRFEFKFEFEFGLSYTSESTHSN